jgi:hypothetical protein
MAMDDLGNIMEQESGESTGEKISLTSTSTEQISKAFLILWKVYNG